jgi:hypothetical protein
MVRLEKRKADAGRMPFWQGAWRSWTNWQAQARGASSVCPLCGGQAGTAFADTHGACDFSYLPIPFYF